MIAVAREKDVRLSRKKNWTIFDISLKKIKNKLKTFQKIRSKVRKKAFKCWKNIIKSCVLGIDPGQDQKQMKGSIGSPTKAVWVGGISNQKIPFASGKFHHAWFKHYKTNINCMMFYSFNQRKECEKHAWNSKVNLVHPIRRFPLFRENLITPD